MRPLMPAISGGIVFSVLVPWMYWMFLSDSREDLLGALPMLLIGGFIVGAILGALFPKLYDVITDILTDL